MWDMSEKTEEKCVLVNSSIEFVEEISGFVVLQTVQKVSASVLLVGLRMGDDGKCFLAISVE